MAGKTISFTIPRWTGNLASNLFGLLSLATICVGIGLLTDYRWGVLAAGVIGTVLTAWIQVNAPADVEAAKPTPLRKAA